MNDLNDLLKILASAPDTQIDKVLTREISKLIDKNDDAFVATELKKILDKAAYASLASDFGMTSMDLAWNIAKGTEKDSIIYK